MWVRRRPQGVLLLNAVLTVRAHSAASHAKRGWEAFTDAAVAELSQRRSGVVFLLWGRYAQVRWVGWWEAWDFFSAVGSCSQDAILLTLLLAPPPPPPPPLPLAGEGQDD